MPSAVGLPAHESRLQPQTCRWSLHAGAGCVMLCYKAHSQQLCSHVSVAQAGRWQPPQGSASAAVPYQLDQLSKAADVLHDRHLPVQAGECRAPGCHRFRCSTGAPAQAGRCTPQMGASAAFAWQNNLNRQMGKSAPQQVSMSNLCSTIMLCAKRLAGLSLTSGVSSSSGASSSTTEPGEAPRKCRKSQ